MDETVTLDWDAHKDSSGRKLLIKYTLHNQSQERIYVLDQLVASYAEGLRILPNAVIVRNGDQAETVKFIRGYIHPTQPVIFILAPAVRALDPGARLQGGAEVPLPLVAWQPIGRPKPLKKPISKMVLEIGYVSGTPEFAGPIASDGTKLASPSLGYLEQHQRFVRTAPKPLP